jgi:hypothetical protein
MKPGLLAIHYRDIGPQFFSALSTAIPNMEGNNLTGCRKAFHHKRQQPRETDTYGTTDPAKRDALTQQAFNQRALLFRNDVAFETVYKLVSTRFELMILFVGPSMAIFLVLVRLALWSCIYDDHTCLLTSAVLATLLGWH